MATIRASSPATIQAAREGWPQRRLVVAFQPHRYTRTRDLIDDFSAVLAGCHPLLITEVYAAGEVPISGADGRALCRAIRARGGNPVFVENVNELPALLADNCAPTTCCSRLALATSARWQRGSHSVWGRRNDGREQERQRPARCAQASRAAQPAHQLACGRAG